MTTIPIKLAEVTVRPEPGDNVAIVSRDLLAGTTVGFDGAVIQLPNTVLEGHRIVVNPIDVGGALMSWSTPFARATRALTPGDYVCTPASLEALKSRGFDGLPEKHSCINEPLDPYQLDESKLNIGAQVDLVVQPRSFLGYARENGIAGTRNHVAIVGVTSLSAAFVTLLAQQLSEDAPSNFDGVVPVAHTEAGEDHRPNNAEFILRVLAGCLIHPNIGAVLVVDEPDGAITASDVIAYMRENSYPDVAVPHGFFTRTGSFTTDLAEAAAIVSPWLFQVAAQRRSKRPLSELRIALQCGGSDAFSGVSANPLAGTVAREVIKHGGAAVLAETDELIGAEGYVLKNVRTLEVARMFLEMVQTFKERVSWHGHTAEGNPSGGNLHRGLYNIVLKSIGAARKLDREVRLDNVIAYAERLPGPGFTFMDSPGNDLESVAGEVASGCNLIFFTTGNGSITNFPFVPTLKFVTTTARFELLKHEMDVDAGRYLTGTSMDELTAEVFDQTIDTASGTPSAGEHAGHSQVSIWRDWKQTEARKGIAISIDGRTTRSITDLPDDERDAELPALPLLTYVDRIPPSAAMTSIPLYKIDQRHGTEQLALILPTSLCAGQIAVRIANTADGEGWHLGTATRTVALPHTEGCGATGGAAQDTYTRTMIGYLAHPNVQMALLLEHGCEKTHNDYFRSRIIEEGINPDRFGWASIQRDGGIDAVTAVVHRWFNDTAATLSAPRRTPGTLADLTVAIEARGSLLPETARAFAELGGWIVSAGGSVICSLNGELLSSSDFREHAFGASSPISPTLAHGQRPKAAGWHVMRMPTSDWLETGSGFGATGAQILLTHVSGSSVSGQRLLQVVQVTANQQTEQNYKQDLDGVLQGGVREQALQLLEILILVASGLQGPRALANGNVGFQITRGLLGTSV